MRPPGTTDARAPSAPAAMADARSADASLGAFLGSLPRDVLARHVLARLDPADLALFAERQVVAKCGELGLFETT